MVTNLILVTILLGRYYNFSYFTDLETESQKISNLELYGL